MLGRRISADHKEVPARLDPTVAGACRQNRDIPGSDFDLTSVLTAEHQASASSREAENFVRR